MKTVFLRTIIEKNSKGCIGIDCIKEKAILFDKKGKSKTHLLLDEDELVGGNNRMQRYSKLITFYENNGFKLLRRDPNDALLQMYCIIGDYKT